MRGIASLPLLTAVIGILCVVILSRPPDKSSATDDQRPLLPRPEFLHVLGAAEQHMLVDYYWVLMTEATGRAHNRQGYRNLYDYAELITELDPQFHYAYLFGGVAIPYNIGRETWFNTDESTRLLRKGFNVFPDDVYLRILIAYNLSYFHHQYKEAADILRETSSMAGAPSYLGKLATRLYAQAGAVDDGLSFAISLSESAPDPDTRAAFEQRTKELLLEKELQRIDKAITGFKNREGRMPQDLDELVTRQDLTFIPSDPLGGKIVIGADGRSYSSVTHGRRLEVFQPQALNP